ncbi:MAG: transporter substrate-binding protein [Rubritepida sp.]|nr:transporter substrate-binding protein [Rubritepida sp.]
MLLGALGLPAFAARAAEPMREMHDITGRAVRIPAVVRRMIVGDGRLMQVIAILEREAPFGRIVGWRDELRTHDRGVHADYLRLYPQMQTLPDFGSPVRGGFDVEQAVALQPDLVITSADPRLSPEAGGLLHRLTSVGIPVLLVDLRQAMTDITERSVRLLGEALGREERAEALIAYRAAQIARVTGRLAQAPPRAPLVMFERAAGRDINTCCETVGRGGFSWMIEQSGGESLGARLLPARGGLLSAEAVIEARPEIVIMAGSNYPEEAPARISLGPGTDMALARQRMRRLLERPAYRAMAVTRTGRIHGIWNQFATSPYHFVAIQVMAKWLHPDRFLDLDPDATFREFHERFLPFPYRPGYWVSL